MEGQPLLIDATAAAKLLGTTAKHVLNMANAGTLPAVRIGKRWRFSPAALKEWAENPPRPEPPARRYDRPRVLRSPVATKNYFPERCAKMGDQSNRG